MARNTLSKSRTLVIIRNDDGCMIPVSHKLNQDGYFRKRWKQTGNPQGEAEMFHRFIFRAHKGDILEGYEINHRCRCRGCCNPEHLEAIEGSDHAILTNTERYADRLSQAKSYWMEHRCTGTKLGDVFGVSFSRACAWVRDWKKELNQ